MFSDVEIFAFVNWWVFSSSSLFSTDKDDPGHFFQSLLASQFDADFAESLVLKAGVFQLSCV